MDIDPNKIAGDISFNNVLLWLLALATVISVLDYIGLMPGWLAKWLARNRLETTLKALKSLGVRVRYDEDRRRLAFIQRALNSLNIKEYAYIVRLREMTAEDTFRGEVEVGGTRTFTSDGFIDLMGATTDYVRCSQYAKLLKTHAEMNAVNDYDIVATPKDGSPLLGYEFAKLVDKPLILGVCEKVSSSAEMEFHAKLDYPKSLSITGKKALIVDDSTTGGRKVTQLAEVLREAGVTVDRVLVVFEPKGKMARDKLKAKDMELSSVIDGPTGRF